VQRFAATHPDAKQWGLDKSASTTWNTANLPIKINGGFKAGLEFDVKPAEQSQTLYQYDTPLPDLDHTLRLGLDISINAGASGEGNLGAFNVGFAASASFARLRLIYRKSYPQPLTTP
jgi:hypothetical protein